MNATNDAFSALVEHHPDARLIAAAPELLAAEIVKMICCICGEPATHSCRYGGDDGWREYACDLHTLPASHWADPHAGADDEQRNEA